MPVIFFQAMIIASLVIARIFAKDKLILVAGGWSVFTFFMVFMPWLMILQLAVIWITYAVVSPKDEQLPPDGKKLS